MKRAIVCGATGLLGSRMCWQLNQEGYHVTALSRSDWNRPHSGFCYAHEVRKVDLRDFHPDMFVGADEVYQFASCVGGLGYITDAANEVEMLRDSTLIDLNVLEACRVNGIKNVFFASSACVYPAGKSLFAEEDAYPADCSNEFAWQKLFAERLYLAYARKYGMQVRIARLFNCFGAHMAWTGGREKVVAALCRKVAAADGNTDTIEVWGNGDQRRSFTYVDDAVEGIRALMRSAYSEPLNIGPSTSLSIAELVRLICKVANKPVAFRYVAGPTGVASICCDTTRMKRELHWVPLTPIEKALQASYFWVQQKVLDKGGRKA
jgi:GDP-D-mannose 3', 5'-epimerase